MNKYFILPVIIIVFSFLFCSTLRAQDDPTAWKYFKILVMVSDDSIFTKLQDDVKMEMPYLTSYTLNVDLRSKDLEKCIIIFGDKDIPSSPGFTWSTLRKEVQDGLIKWNKKNKIKLD